MTLLLFLVICPNSFVYLATPSCTLAFSTDSCRLDAEASTLTLAPTFELNLSCATVTFYQTAPCDFDTFAASFKSFVAAVSDELANVATSSWPRLAQRPDSIQNAES